MSKKEIEKTWKATSKLNTEINNDNDISNLNDDNSFLPIEEEERAPLSEEEKKSIRKKLFFLLIIVVIVLIALLVTLIFNPFQSNKKTTDEETKPTIEEEVNDNDNDNNNEEEKIPEENNDEKPISQLEDGTIPLTNIKIQSLSKEIVNLYKDYYEHDNIALYKNGNTNIDNLKDETKLFLLSKTNNFSSLVKSKNNLENICNSNGNIIIEKKDIDEILNKRFNTPLSNYIPFIYNIYNEAENYTNTIKFTYQNNQYIGKCHTLNTEIDSITQQLVTSATKEQNKLYVDVKVVFINKTGVYQDPNFNTLITNKNQTFDQYIEKGNVYRYTYDINNDQYSLINITLLK